MPSILIITNRFDPHVDFMVERFNAAGHPFIRFNTDDFPRPTSLSVSCGRDGGYVTILREAGRIVHEQNIGAVWHRRPGEFPAEGLDAESRRFARQEMRELVRGWWSLLSSHKWVSDPFAIDRARHKVLQLQLAGALGFRLPRTLITTDPDEFRSFWDSCDGVVVYKPLGLAVSWDEEDRYHFTPTRLLDQSFLERVEGIKAAPCIFQEYVQKKFELRITVIERRVFSCAIHSQDSSESKIDWRLHSDVGKLRHAVYDLPAPIEHRCIDLVARLGLRSGMIDMVVTPEEEHVFLEVNPNGQWLWVEEMTGLPISDGLVAALTSSGT